MQPIYRSIPTADMKCNSELVGLADPAEIATVFGWMKYDITSHTRFTFDESRRWGRSVKDKIGFKSIEPDLISRIPPRIPPRILRCQISYAKFETLRDDGVFTTYSNGVYSDLAITLSTAIKYNLVDVDDFICTCKSTCFLDMKCALELYEGYMVNQDEMCGFRSNFSVGVYLIPDVVVKSAGKE
jgi:hypothetical protein